MNIYYISTILAAGVLCTAGIYFIIFLRSAKQTLENIDKTMEQIRYTTNSLEKTVSEAEITLGNVNSRLPQILDDLEETAANTRSISQNTDEQIRRGIETFDNTVTPVINAASSFGKHVLKNALLRKIKRNRF